MSFELHHDKWLCPVCGSFYNLEEAQNLLKTSQTQLKSEPELTAESNPYSFEVPIIAGRIAESSRFTAHKVIVPVGEKSQIELVRFKNPS